MPAKIVDRFNVDGEDYAIEPVIDPVPVEGSQHAVMGGGVYTSLQSLRADINLEIQRIDNDKSSVPIQGGTQNFTAGGAFSFFANSVNASDWLAKLFGHLLCRYWNSASGAPGSSYTNICLEYGNGKWIGTWYNSSFDTYIQLVSTNGKGWSSVASIPNLRSLKFADNIWVGASAEGVWWSEDGVNWTAGEGITVGTGYVYYAEWLGLWLCGCNAASTGGAWWSEDGKNWTQCTGIDTSAGLNGVKGKGLLVGKMTTANGAWWSTNGKDWSQVPNTAGYSVYNMEVDNSHRQALVACATGGTNFITLRGANTATILPRFEWNVVSGLPSGTIYSFASNTQGEWAIGTASGIYYIPANANEAYLSVSTSSTVNMVAHLNNNTIAVTADRSVYVASDGGLSMISGGWKLSPTVADPGNEVVYANGLWIISGAASLSYSTDGVIWIEVYGVSGAVKYGQGVWVAATSLKYSDIDSLFTQKLIV